MGGEASLLLMGDVLMSSEHNELLVFIGVGSYGGCLRIEGCCMMYSTRRCCGAIRR